MRLGVLGGTLDPVHNGHLALAEAAYQQLGLDRVLFVPAGQPWRKAGRAISSAEHRLALLRLAIADNAALEVSTMEVEREGPTYTAETLAALSSERPGVEMVFILGEDALDDLPNWVEPGRIMELATLAVARRGAGGSDRHDTPVQSAGIVWLEMPPIEVSASEVRERVRSGRPISDLVPPAVEAYIRAHGLYRS